jgi:hypothetical protein
MPDSENRRFGGWINLRPFPGVAVSEAVHDILERIQRLPAVERLLLEDYLAKQGEAQCQREGEEARRLARQKGGGNGAAPDAGGSVNLATQYWHGKGRLAVRRTPC